MSVRAEKREMVKMYEEFYMIHGFFYVKFNEVDWEHDAVQFFKWEIRKMNVQII